MRYYTVLMDGEEKVATSVDGKSLYMLDGFNDMDALIAAGSECNPEGCDDGKCRNG